MTETKERLTTVLMVKDRHATTIFEILKSTEGHFAYRNLTGPAGMSRENEYPLKIFKGIQSVEDIFKQYYQDYPQFRP